MEVAQEAEVDADVEVGNGTRPLTSPQRRPVPFGEPRDSYLIPGGISRAATRINVLCCLHRSPACVCPSHRRTRVATKGPPRERRAKEPTARKGRAQSTYQPALRPPPASGKVRRPGARSRWEAWGCPNPPAACTQEAEPRRRQAATTAGHIGSTHGTGTLRSPQYPYRLWLPWRGACDQLGAWGQRCAMLAPLLSTVCFQELSWNAEAH